jgi:flavin-dependent dehydrogenase
MTEHTDALIVGSGPAGAAAGITLAEHGASVLVVDRSLRRPTLGEGLPPAATPMLERLGLREWFLDDGHGAAYGNRSAWGSSDLNDVDFIRSPYGAGWHLDRSRFDAMLRARLAQLGVSVHENARVAALHRTRGGHWALTLASGHRTWEIQSSFLVDATGRARSVARSQGTRRRTYDRLVGVVAVLTSRADADFDSFTLVEAVREGWWYAALLPERCLVVGYMTDADIAAATDVRSVEGWMSLLEETVQIRDRVARYDYRLQGSLRLVCADSSRLETMVGDGWCAVGDAAAAHDPLSSQGILSALTSGVWAGQAIASGHKEDLAAYEQRMQDHFARYLANWMAYYAEERRWPRSLFWQRRHGMLEQLLAS